MEKLGDMIRDFTGDAKIKTRITEARAIFAWNNVVGDKILLNAVPVRIKAGTLYVSVKTASWAQELKGLEPVIIERINEYLGLKTVKEIRFFQKNIRKEKGEASESIDKKPSTDLIEISSNEKDEIDKIAKKIENNELKDAFRRILEKDKKLHKWRDEKR